MKAKPLDNAFRPALAAETAQVFILMGQIAVLLQKVFQRIAIHLAHSLFQMAQLVAHGENIVKHLHHRIQKRKPRCKLRHLLHIPYGMASTHGKLAFIKTLLAGNAAEQRGFAGAVGANQPHLLAFLHIKIHILEN